jgi:hypothetical protein
MSDLQSGLVKDLISLAQEGVQFHARMSANPEPKEGFVRDWIAAKLHKLRGGHVAIEVNRGEFRCYVADPANRAKFDDAYPKGFRVDMMVWSPKPDDQPYALVEMKRLARVRSDIDRTSRLLTFCKPVVFGYQLVCFAKPGEVGLRQFVCDAKKTILSMQSVGDVAEEGTPFQVNTDKDQPSGAWCQIVVFSVLPASTT